MHIDYGRGSELPLAVRQYIIGFSFLDVVMSKWLDSGQHGFDTTAYTQTDPLGSSASPGVESDTCDCFVCYCKAREVPGVKVFSFSSSLYYANADHFVRQLYKQTDCSPELINELRAQQQRRRTEAIRRREKAESVALKRKKRLKLTADHDDTMFTVMCWHFFSSLYCCLKKSQVSG